MLNTVKLYNLKANKQIIIQKLYSQSKWVQKEP